MHKDAFADAMAAAKRVQRQLVQLLDDEPAKFWVFDCLSIECRKTVVVSMIGGTRPSTAPRVVCLALQAQGGSRHLFGFMVVP